MARSGSPIRSMEYRTIMKAVGKSPNSRRRFTASIRNVATYVSSRVISKARTGSPSHPTRRGFTYLKPATKQRSIRANIFASSTSQTKDYRCPGERFFTRSNPATAMACASTTDGNIWSSAADGVHCINSDGELLGKILVPYRVSNLTFGGVVKNRLFIGGSSTLYSIFLNCRGVQTP